MAACILAYPVLVHLSVLLDRPALAVAALVLLGASFLWTRLRQRRPGAWAGLAVVTVAAVLAAHQGVALYALYLPPVVLPAALGLWWGRSLRAGAVPVVTRIATAVRGDLSPEYAAYTRGVTVAWTVLFAAFALSAALLVALAPTPVWSFTVHFVNPAVIAAAFVIEYALRLRRFPDLEHPSFSRFLQIVVKRGARPGGSA